MRRNSRCNEMLALRAVLWRRAGRPLGVMMEAIAGVGARNPKRELAARPTRYLFVLLRAAVTPRMIRYPPPQKCNF